MHSPILNRRQLLALALAGATGSFTRRAEAAPKRVVESGIAWYDVQSWGVEGKGWSDTARYFDRLPARAQGKVREPVWTLSRHSAGMLVRFETDAAEIHARCGVLSPTLAMPHMPATGVSGLDLYARDEQGRDRWLGVAMPRTQQYTSRLAAGIDPFPGGGPRMFTVYLPLYNGVETLEIGVPEKALFRPMAPRTDGAILFYGTSIMHGACATRPGMSISGILGRRLDRPTINLGFSGNGRMEKEVGDFLVELNPAVYAIDCLPNMTPELVAQHTEPLVRQLRAARPATPILLVEDRTFTNAPFQKSHRDNHAARRKALREAYERLKRDGVRHLAYLKGADLVGHDGEGATDGSHPSDLGMVRYADAYEPVLRRLLS